MWGMTFEKSLRMFSPRTSLLREAERYRWLRDRAGNAIMLDLMAECRPDEWDKLVDEAMRADPTPAEPTK